jgi:peptidoglycan/xylan/chitin deacetylase (PgdA/CDA1 family)
MGNDIPYIVNAGLGSIVEVPVHWELDDHPFFNYSPYLGQTNVAASPRHVFEIWSAAFEGLYNYRRSFVLTMHPWIIGRPGRLEMLRQLVEHIKAFDGAEFMTILDLVHLYRNNI